MKNRIIVIFPLLILFKPLLITPFLTFGSFSFLKNIIYKYVHNIEYLDD